MKLRIILLLLPLMLLFACTACREETPEVRDGFVSNGDVFNYCIDSVPVSFSPGMQTIDAKSYYVEPDGVSICALTDCLAEKNGRLLYFTDDSSLQFFEAGFVTVDGDLYYAPEDGYLLMAAREQVVPIGDRLYAFDEDCRVIELTAGVQELFGGLYYVPEDGIEIACPPEGVLLTEDALYYANADGSLAADALIGYLHFGADGRYTSGSETLDEQVEALLTQAQADFTDPIEAFRLCYAYIRDHYRYISMAHYPAGSDDWAQSCAEIFFQNGKGNCYCWAAAQMYCARRLGIQAYCVAGWEDNPHNDHAWVMAEINGAAYLFDAELEYALDAHPDMFMATLDSAYSYNGYYYYFP
ncbi:MAG: transglutaminase domain-containing protein [Oscillospiraceae bacterium]|nr:transglutaminase domain-containing protein [Oscillospiraceae bacterium]